MRTTTVTRTALELTHPELNGADLQLALDAHLAKAISVLEAFATAQGTTSDNLVSQTDCEQRITVRSWPDLATAQAWVDLVLAGDLAQDLEHPAVIISAVVDPE